MSTRLEVLRTLIGTRRAADRAAEGRARRDPSQTRAIRAWAQSQGIAVSDRGRIPADIEAKYHAAMKG